MNELMLGITGTFQSLPHAKRGILIAATASILLSCIFMLHGNYWNVIPVGLALLLFFLNSRVVAAVLFIWTLLFTMWIFIMVLLNGRSLWVLHLPIFGALVLWLQLRAIFATVYIEKHLRESSESVTSIFE